jgi:hypothetical protein
MDLETKIDLDIKQLISEYPHRLSMNGDNGVNYKLIIKEDTYLIFQLTPFKILSREGHWYKEDKDFFKYEVYHRIRRNGVIRGIRFIIKEYALGTDAPGMINIANNADLDETYNDNWNVAIISATPGLKEFINKLIDGKIKLTLISYGVRQSSKPQDLDGNASALGFDGRSAGNLKKLRGTDDRLQKAIITSTFMFENQITSILKNIVLINQNNIRYGIYCSKGHHRSGAVVESLNTYIFNEKAVCQHPHFWK